jgi:hypothetical protein
MPDAVVLSATDAATERRASVVASFVTYGQTVSVDVTDFEKSHFRTPSG